MLFVSSVLAGDVTKLARTLASSSPSTCRSCVESSSERWCTEKGITTPSEGDCCDSGDSSGYCSGSNSYVCSNSNNIDSAESQYNGGLILCPTKSSDCGKRNRKLSSSSDSENITESLISSSSVCVYRIYTTSSLVKSVEIEINDSTRATITIFTGPRSKNEYAYKGTLKEADRKSVTVDENNDAYIVVEPSSLLNRVDIDVQASTASLKGKSSAGVVVGILFGVICGLAIVICAAVIVIGVCIKRRKEKSGNSSEGSSEESSEESSEDSPESVSNKTEPNIQLFHETNLQINIGGVPLNASYQIPHPPPLQEAPQYVNPGVDNMDPYMADPPQQIQLDPNMQPPPGNIEGQNNNLPNAPPKKAHKGKFELCVIF
ncbi:unnamed protein product [Moneuplotes crassus]|uniref:Uncharacterized protein n=1 Tax=Euplotes crassus TaxID=5936 RepID=A0AAD1U937_EUPCR|nr:unnamed protein product [Moneuplotes crassus]